MKNILVTGGCGFLGCNLIENLLDVPENNIIVFDNLSTGTLANIERFGVRKNLQFYKVDIGEKIDYHVFKDIRLHEIYNLACPASPKYYQKFPIETTKASVLGIIALLELAIKHDAKLLHTSTSEIYGDAKVHPQKEDYWGSVNPIGVRSCYDEGKRCAESLIFDYMRVHNVDVRIVRIFNTYGPYMKDSDGRVVTNFIMQALNGDDITIYGDGEQTRSFCYVDDLINGLIKYMAIEKDKVLTPLNMGNPVEFSVKQIAELIKKLTLSNSKVVYTIKPQDDPNKRKPDINAAKNILKWEPIMDIKTGLTKTIEYLKTQ